VADEVLVEREGRTLVVTINRAHVRNAIDRATAEGIARAMDELDSDPALMIGILTGAGGTFCAGMDLKAFLRGERPEIEGRGLAGMTETPPRKPVIAAVEGYALAGGCEIVLACDMVVAARDAAFGLPEVTRGLVAGSGGLIRLPRRIPQQIAIEYALTGAHLPAVDAHHWGLVNRLTEPGGAVDGARELARSVAANGPLAVAMTKHIISAAASWPTDEVWDRVVGFARFWYDFIVGDSITLAVGGAAAIAGAAAFAAKRPPQWSGR